MSSSQVALMGAIAGVTIFLGLPIGRLRNPLPRLKAALNGLAIGVLLFLVWDILTHAWEPVDAALAGTDWAIAARDGAVLAAGLVLGMAGLVYFDKAMSVRRSRTQILAASLPSAGSDDQAGRLAVATAAPGRSPST